MVSGLRVSVDRELCTGTGSCVFAAPDVFEQDDTDGRVVLLREHPEPGESDDVQEAADVCPVAAIKLHRR